MRAQGDYPAIEIVVVEVTDAKRARWPSRAHFGTWLRIAADLPQGAELIVLITVHVKA